MRGRSVIESRFGVWSLGFAAALASIILISGVLTADLLVRPAAARVVAARPTADAGIVTGENVEPPASDDAPLQSDPPEVTATPSLDSTSDSVGATVAQFRVDEGGNATYSVPIQLPPGTAGLAPKLALTYNSRGGSGPMGPGWSIMGSSQITRCRQARENGDFMSGTTPIDGDPPPVNFTTTDRFCLDGVRLLLTSGIYGANNSTYSPENDPTTKVFALTTNAASGPDSFTVKRKDGTTSFYGDVTLSPASRASAAVNGSTAYLTWSIARTQDTVSNYIDYLYQNQPAAGVLPFAAGAVESVLKQVNYTGHLGTPAVAPYVNVVFNYVTLPSAGVRLGYQAGVAFLQSQQLTSVSVQQPEFSANPTTRYYSLVYGASVSGSGAQQLRQIKECRDSSLAVCYPPTTFSWSAANYSFVNDAVQTHSGPDFKNIVGYKVADVDGDGRQDFVWAKNNDGACPNASRIYVSFLDRTSSNQMTLVTPTQAAICSTFNLQNNDAAWHLLDYDGDGRADLLIGGGVKVNGTLVGTTTTWAAIAGQGRSPSVFGGTNLLAVTINVPTGLPPAGVVADLNGDGLPDFIYAGAGASDSFGYNTPYARLLRRSAGGALAFSSTAYRVSINLGAGDTLCDANGCRFNFFMNNPLHRSAIASDINGDGRADLTLRVQPIPDGCPTCRASDPIFDPTLGFDDSTTAAAGARWYQFLAGAVSEGTFPAIALNAYWNSSIGGLASTMPTTSDKIYVLDLNGDGLSDIFYQDLNNATTYWALINTGRGYQAPISVSNVTGNGASPPIQLADINGDGRTEIVYFTSNSTSSYVSLVPSTASSWAFTAPASVPGGGIHTSNPWIDLLGDFDGDGAPDWLMVQTQDSSSNLYTSRASASSRYRPRDVITGFTNGLGAATSVVYQPLTNKGVYQRGIDNEMPSVTQHNFGWGSPVLDVLAPIYVVSQASSSAPVRGNANAQSTIYYRYQAALMQSGGRGFLGFWQTQSFDGNDSASTGGYAVTANGYAQSYPFIGMPLVTGTMKFTGTLTRGSAELDACAADPETAAYNCFAPVGAPRWPDLLARGIWVQYDGQSVHCKGAGCTPPANDELAQCSALSTTEIDSSEPDPQPFSYLLDGLFVPTATAAPLFAYVHWSETFQFSPENTAPGVSASRASYIFSRNCYDDDYGNLSRSHTTTRDGGGAIVAQKLVANSYTNDVFNWLLGRLTNSRVTFSRPGQTNVVRTADFTYDPTTGLLTSERVQKGLGADQDLRTMYRIDTFGNRTEAWQCSAELTDTQCISSANMPQRPVDTTGHSGTLVHRYAKTVYGTRGRYIIGSRVPFYSSTAANNLNEQSAYTISGRDEFGNVTQQSSINGLAQTSLYGALGRPYYAADNLGHASTTTYRLCTVVTCPQEAKFRSQTVTAGAPSSWTYYDVLGRTVLKVVRNFDLNASAQQFSGVCSFYDSHGRSAYVSEPFFVMANVAGDGSPTLATTTTCNSAAYATTTQYDVVGRVKNVSRPDGGSVQMSYIGLHTFTTDARGYSWEEVKNALGETIQKRDPDVPSDPNDNLIVDQGYDAAGNLVSITRDAGSGAIMTTATYDALGRKRSMSDPDAGTGSFRYNAAGEAISQTDAKGQTIQSDYDAMGRLWRRTAPGADGNTLTDTWTYDTAANGYGQIASEARVATASAAWSRSTTYDVYGRLSLRSTSIAGNSYTESTSYDGFSRPRTQRDATGYTTTTNYSPNGYVQSLFDSRVNGTIYEMLSTTARGQVRQDRRGGNANLLNTMSYNASNGRLAAVCAGAGCALQDLSYTFDLNGNLTQRARGISTQPTVETAAYDALNRLTQTSVTQIQGVVQNPPAPANYVYDKLGNLCTNSGINYTYAGRAGCPNHGTAGSPHAVASRVGGGTYTYDADGNLSGGTSGRTFAWNALNQLTSVSSSAGGTTTFDYAPDGSRFRRTDSSTNSTVYIVGNVEIVVVAGNPAAGVKRRYLGVAIDFLYGNNTTETRYVFNDHLGSYSVYANPTGGLIAEQSFRAFGTNRDPVTWQGSATQPAGTSRGFTGHEHVTALNIVHMNGRIYDPQIGRMLQPDPLADGSNQGLNRYSYVVNNPLTLTDPSGYSWFGDILRAVVGIAIAIWAPQFLAPYLGGFGSVVASGFLAGVVTSGNLQGGIYGAFSAGLFFGIGSAFQQAGWATSGQHVFGTEFNSIGFAAKVVAHGAAGGVMSSLQGGKFGNGFLSAGVTQAFSGGIDQIDVGTAGVSAQRVVAAAILGGTTSVIAGGKFANGAVTGAFSRAFNDEHSRFTSRRSVTLSKSSLNRDGGYETPREAVLAQYAAYDDVYARTVEDGNTEVLGLVFAEGDRNYFSTVAVVPAKFEATISLDGIGASSIAGYTHTHPSSDSFNGIDYQVPSQRGVPYFVRNSGGNVFEWSPSGAASYSKYVNSLRSSGSAQYLSTEIKDQSKWGINSICPGGVSCLPGH